MSKNIIYKVRGKKYLSKEELSRLISSMKEPVLKYDGGCVRPVAPDETFEEFEDAWHWIASPFDKENIALEYARLCMAESLDGGYVVVEKIRKKFLFFKEKQRIIYELKKKDGKISEIAKQQFISPGNIEEGFSK